MNAEVTSHAALRGALYPPSQVGLASYLGTPIAGAWLLRENYRLLGGYGAGRNAIVWGFGISLGLLGLAFVLPENVPDWIIPLFSWLVMSEVAKRLQGGAFDAHIAAGGKKQPWLRAVGIGFAGALAVLVAVLVAGFIAASTGLLVLC